MTEKRGGRPCWLQPVLGSRAGGFATRRGDYTGPMAYTLADETRDAIVTTCDACDRGATYWRAELVQRFGANMPLPTLLVHLSADCPKRTQSVQVSFCRLRYVDPISTRTRR